MATPTQRDLLSAPDALRSSTLARARNTLRYGVFGELDTTGETLSHIVEAVPLPIAGALPAHAFVFVPLALGETSHARETEIARVHTPELADRAICHRTVPLDGTTYTFISTRLMGDRFALAFELYINVGHEYVDSLGEAAASLPARFTDLLWSQAGADVRGETSQDSYDARKRAIELLSRPGNPGVASKTRQAVLPADRDAKPDADGGMEQQSRFFEAAFADALAIYMLSLAIDLDYADLREREYPLLAAPALADRLRLMAELFPPPPGYEFAIRYRRRHWPPR